MMVAVASAAVIAGGLSRRVAIVPFIVIWSDGLITKKRSGGADEHERESLGGRGASENHG